MLENRNHTPSAAPVKHASPRATAVAIASNPDAPDAPAQIVATGRGKLAQEIVEIAFSHGIKVREDAPLASLLAELDLDTPIPSEAIVAVAEILAKVYEANAAYAAPKRKAAIL